MTQAAANSGSQNLTALPGVVPAAERVIDHAVSEAGRYANAWPISFCIMVCCALITGGYVYSSSTRRVEIDTTQFMTQPAVKKSIEDATASLQTQLGALITMVGKEHDERLASEKEHRASLSSIERSLLELASKAR